MQDEAHVEEIRRFWFGQASDDDLQIAARMARWFGSSEEVDVEIKERFSGLVTAAAQGELDPWRRTPRGSLALIILLDQFPRNLYRGTPAAFASDPRALELCLTELEAGRHLSLGYIEQVFFMMPLQHSESRAVQADSVRRFEALVASVPEDRRGHFQGFAGYARLHSEIVQQFGRFPHRNAILGRANTPEEEAYLAGDAPRFGQK